MGFDYIMKVPPLLLSHCHFFIFGYKISFLVGYSLFCYDFYVFMTGGELKFLYSTIVSWMEGLLLVLNTCCLFPHCVLSVNLLIESVQVQQSLWD